MSAITEFDLGPLTWVRDEIQRALDQARENLGRFAENLSDTTPLRFCLTHLHQVTGALQMVGLEGPARFSDEVEQLVGDVEQGRVPARPEHADLLGRAIAALGGYLDGLINGEPNVPLKLFPVYRELCLARGAEKPSESDLFFPDLGIRAPKNPAFQAVDGPQLAKFAKDQRGLFQRGLLKWLRNQDEPEGLGAMRDAVAALDRCQPLPVQRTFWWAALALLDSLINKGLDPDFNVKQLCARIDLQMRRLTEGSHQVAERLLRDVLYLVAKSPPVSESVREVKRIFELDDHLPSAPREMLAEEAALAGLQPLLRELRGTLAAAKEAWLKYTSGKKDSLDFFRHQVSALHDKSQALENSAFKGLLGQVEAASRAAAEVPAARREAVAMETATALLLLESALENYARLTPEFAQQAEVQGGRLQASLSGEAEGTAAPAIPLLDEFGRKAQEKLLLAQVAHEIQANLRQIEQVLDAFFRDQTRRSDLAALTPLLHQISGALAMLDLAKAMELLEASQTLIRKFGDPDYAVDQAELELVAEALSSLGFYIEAVQYGRPDADNLIEQVLKRVAAGRGGAVPAAEEAAPQASVESGLAMQKQRVREYFEQWRSQPEDEALRQQLAQALKNLRHDADLVADEALNRQAGEALKLTEQSPSAPDQALAGIIAAIAAGKVQAEAPSAQASRLLHATEETVDAELLGTYLEEAHEVLAAVAENLRVCRERPHDREALTTIRRGFHTLKGSGRMVGLAGLGEVAWNIEQVMNQWLEEERSATPALLELIARAHGAFSRWVQELSDSGVAEVDADDLLTLAGQLKAGEPAQPDVPLPEPQAPIESAPPEPEAVAAPEVPPQEGAPVAPEVQQPEPAAAEPDIVIGEAVLSPALFAIFMDEAQYHLDTLGTQFASAQVDPDAPIAHDFMRAAHTLCGIARTTGFPALADLAHALERWLQERLEHPGTLGAKHIKVLGDTIAGLGRMLQTIATYKQPKPAKQLMRSLEAMLKHAASEREPAEAAVPPAEVAPSGAPQPVAEAAEAAPTAEVRPERRVIRDDLDPQLLPIFLEEAGDLFPEVGGQLRQWRAEPGDTQAAQALRRTLHTLKGSARMAGAMRLGELTHNMETRVIAAVEEGPVPSALFDDLDADFDRLGDTLERLQHGGEAPPEEAAVAEQPPEPVAAAEPDTGHAEAEQQRAVLRVRADVVDRLVNEAGEVSIARSRIEGEMLAFKQGVLDLTENVGRLRHQLREIEIQAESQMQSRFANTGEEDATFDPLEFDRFTRFQELTRMMAESVNDVATVQQTLLRNLDETEAALLQQARMNRDLQQELMRVRMVPLASLAERLHRVVRQTAKELGKKVNLDIRGGNVEIDRSVLEKMTAPFEHLLRNAIVHGLEDTARRVAAGKHEIGELSLEARQQGNEIVLKFGDDGAGIDLDVVRQKAEQLGLLEPGEQAPDARLMELTFTPGFSTSEQLTQVSGRGIGMDVVRSEVIGLGGRIEVFSEKGRGATFTIYLPLTLAVTQAVLVSAASQLYAVPSVMVEQVQELKPDVLERLYREKEVEWQGEHYPFFYLPRLLGDQESAPAGKRYNSVLLLRSGAQRAAIHVDDLVGNREVVVKNIGPQLARVSGVAGATVLGNGQVVIILNPVQLAQREPIVPATARSAEAAGEQGKPGAAPLVMVVDDSLTVRKITGNLLAREGYQVITAKDGVEALQALQDNRPDVMLVDIEMPRMDGFELTKNVRNDPATAHIPIIMITSRTAEKHRNYAKELGVDAYLGKPYQEQELLDHIESFVKAAVH